MAENRRGSLCEKPCRWDVDLVDVAESVPLGPQVVKVKHGIAGWCIGVML